MKTSTTIAFAAALMATTAHAAPLGQKEANCWNAMGNQYVDLKNAFCAGGACDTKEEAKKLEGWWPSSVAFESGGRVEGRSCPALYRPTYIDWCWNKMGNTYPDLKNAFCAGGDCDTKEEAEKLSNWYPSSIQYESGGRWAGKSCHEEQEIQRTPTVWTYRASSTRNIHSGDYIDTLTDGQGNTVKCSRSHNYGDTLMWCTEGLSGRITLKNMPKLRRLYLSNLKSEKNANKITELVQTDLRPASQAGLEIMLGNPKYNSNQGVQVKCPEGRSSFKPKWGDAFQTIVWAHVRVTCTASF